MPFAASSMQLVINSSEPLTYHTIPNITIKPYIPMILLRLIALSVEPNLIHMLEFFSFSCLMDFHISHPVIRLGSPMAVLLPIG